MSTATEPDTVTEPDAVPETTEVTGEAERPEHLPENFETVEALARSYRHAQAELTKKSQQLAELSREHDRLLAEFESMLSEREILGARISGLEAAFVSQMAGRR